MAARRRGRRRGAGSTYHVRARGVPPIAVEKPAGKDGLRQPIARLQTASVDGVRGGSPELGVAARLSGTCSVDAGAEDGKGPGLSQEISEYTKSTRRRSAAPSLREVDKRDVGYITTRSSAISGRSCARKGQHNIALVVAGHGLARRLRLPIFAEHGSTSPPSSTPKRTWSAGRSGESRSIDVRPARRACARTRHIIVGVSPFPRRRAGRPTTSSTQREDHLQLLGGAARDPRGRHVHSPTRRLSSCTRCLHLT